MKKNITFLFSILFVGSLGIGCKKESVAPVVNHNKTISYATVSGKDGNKGNPKPQRVQYTGTNPLQTNWKHPKYRQGIVQNGVFQQHPSIESAIGPHYTYNSAGQTLNAITDTYITTALSSRGLGNYKKVYDHCLLNGQKVELHYFRQEGASQVFDVKTKLGASDYDNHYNNRNNHKQSPFYKNMAYNHHNTSQSNHNYGNQSNHDYGNQSNHHYGTQSNPYNKINSP